MNSSYRDTSQWVRGSESAQTLTTQTQEQQDHREGSIVYPQIHSGSAHLSYYHTDFDWGYIYLILFINLQFCYHFFYETLPATMANTVFQMCL